MLSSLQVAFLSIPGFVVGILLIYYFVSISKRKKSKNKQNKENTYHLELIK